MEEKKFEYFIGIDVAKDSLAVYFSKTQKYLTIGNDNESFEECFSEIDKSEDKEKTLVILKPCTVQRGLIGEIVTRFEKKGLRLAGMKMVWLTDEILSEHYAHLKEKPFFQRIKDAMSVCPVIVCCWEGVDAIHVVRTLAGATNGRNAAPGTIRGDYSMSVQENIVHASDSPETAEIELKRFFKDDEIFDYELKNLLSLYANDEF